MITCNFRNGRLGEITYMLYGLFYFCIKNNIPLNQIIIDKNYSGKAFFTKITNYVIKDNFEFFNNIKHIFVTNFNEIFSNPIVIPKVFCNMYSQDKFQYDSAKNYILSDYWHFPINLKLFRALFKNKELINRLKNKYNNIDFSYSCSIHVRRKDFVKIQNNEQNLLNKFYDKKPISLDEIFTNIKKMPAIKNFLIFSDDIDWCKQNIKISKSIFIEGNKPYEDMTLIGMCSKHIVNQGSYFSYCGVMLS